MAAIPSTRSGTSLAIDAYFETVPLDPQSATLRCSGFGEACDRKLWYRFRWAHEPERFKPRILRVLKNGHDREDRIVEMLKAAGLTVLDRDPATGQQWRVTLAGGLLTGSCDGIVTGVPEAPVARHLLEIKTMNKTRWAAWRAKGVRVSDPKYYVQMQLYMHGLGLDRALFVAEDQDSKEIEAERISYDPAFALAQVERARRIALAETPPQRMSEDPEFWECRFCPAKAICHAGAPAVRNCRTCLAGLMTGWPDWSCQRHGVDLSDAAQAEGCAVHLYLPGLVPGEQIDADETACTVTYRLDGGALWVDGPHEREA